MDGILSVAVYVLVVTVMVKLPIGIEDISHWLDLVLSLPKYHIGYPLDSLNLLSCTEYSSDNTMPINSLQYSGFILHIDKLPQLAYCYILTDIIIKIMVILFEFEYLLGLC